MLMITDYWLMMLLLFNDVNMRLMINRLMIKLIKIQLIWFTILWVKESSYN